VSSEDLKTPLSRHTSTDEIPATEKVMPDVTRGKIKNTHYVVSGEIVTNGRNGQMKSGGWFRSSLNRAFRKSQKGANIPSKNKSGSMSESEILSDVDMHTKSLPSSPITNRKVLEPSDSPVSDQLRKQLAEKERQLTDLRLESLTTAHQMDSLNETLNELRIEVSRLRNENDGLRSVLESDQRSQMSFMPVKTFSSSTRSNSTASVRSSALPTPTESTK
jgi:neuron navigator 2